jgi:hypothetical protein
MTCVLELPYEKREKLKPAAGGEYVHCPKCMFWIRDYELLKAERDEAGGLKHCPYPVVNRESGEGLR